MLLFSQLWDRVWKYSVFGHDEPEQEPILVCGVDCSAYPIFTRERVVRAAAFAERWHHGQYRRTGEPYVTHCVEAARILAALLPPSAESRRYVDAIVACILHDVVDDTECALEDVRVVFGVRVASSCPRCPPWANCRRFCAGISAAPLRALPPRWGGGGALIHEPWYRVQGARCRVMLARRTS